jgi:hypothetical protein
MEPGRKNGAGPKKWSRAEKQVPFGFAQGRLSTPATTAPKAGAKNQVVVIDRMTVFMK